MEKEKSPPKKPSQLDTTQAKPEPPPPAVHNQVEVTDKSIPSIIPRTSIAETSQIGQLRPKPPSAAQREAAVVESRLALQRGVSTTEPLAAPQATSAIPDEAKEIMPLRFSQQIRVPTTVPIAAPQPTSTIPGEAEEFKPRRFSEQLRVSKIEPTGKSQPSSVVQGEAEATRKPHRLSFRSRGASTTEKLDPQQEPKEAQRRDSFPNRIFSRVLDTVSRTRSSPKTSDLDVPADSSVAWPTEKRSSLKPIIEERRRTLEAAGVQTIKSDEPRKRSKVAEDRRTTFDAAGVDIFKSDEPRKRSKVAEDRRSTFDAAGVEIFKSDEPRKMSKVAEARRTTFDAAGVEIFKSDEPRKMSKVAEARRTTFDAAGVDIFKSDEPRKISAAYNPFGSFQRGASISHPETDDADRKLSTASEPRVSISESRHPGVIAFPEKAGTRSSPNRPISRKSFSPRAGGPRSVSVVDLTRKDVAICFFPEEPDWGSDDDDDEDKRDKFEEDDDSGMWVPVRGRSDSIFPDPNTPYDWSQRERWHSRLVYLIALVTYSISFSNIYHFPALVYHYGGVPFLIPYTIFTIILGYPLHFLESSLGQYSQSGPVRVWDAAPIARGVGWSMFFLCLVIAYYYNMYAAYSVIYFARCFNAILPWQDCDEPATSNYSCVPRMCVRPDTNHYTPAEHYFFHHVLQIHPSSEILGRGLGPMVWTQVVGFLFAWVIIYVAIIQSVRSIGKIVFVLVILPYFILLMLLTAGLLLQGSSRGLELLFATNFSRLLDIQLWRVAAEEVFFELGICQGTPLAYGSYCHHRNPTHIDSAIICVVNYLTSILCALVIFLILGALSMEIGAPVADVLHHGPGIVFIAYPEALSRVPGSHVWCFMFFLMLFSVAIGTQIAIMETVMTVVYDEFQNARPYRWMINLLICCCLFLLGIILCTANGYFVVHLLDRMSGTMPRLPIAVCMVGTIVLIYGTSKYCEDVHFMIGYYPNVFIRICLSVTPFLLLALTIPSWILKEPLTTLGRNYSSDAINVGWFTIWFILIWILLGTIYWCSYCYSIGEMSGIFRSLNSWGPRIFEARVARTEFSSEEMNNFTKPWTKKAVRIEAGDVG